tara:strand:- start:388 stop:642 length:255 start_codon:yes stop_codon:yes gene_type:complete
MVRKSRNLEEVEEGEYFTIPWSYFTIPNRDLRGESELDDSERSEEPRYKSILSSSPQIFYDLITSEKLARGIILFGMLYSLDLT